MAYRHPDPLSSDTPPSSGSDPLPHHSRRQSKSQPPSKRHTRLTSTDNTTNHYDEEDSHRHRHRHHHRSTSSSRFLARVLSQEDDDARKMSSLLLIANERLEGETHRANEAERKAGDLIRRFREAIQGRDSALQDTSRLREELSLYKLQLDNAQREIFRAQETIHTVAREKNDAEADAARARTQARMLQEEKAVMLAREEGRKVGFREGLERGRMMGWSDGRRDVNGGSIDDDYEDEEEDEEEIRPARRRVRSPEPRRPIATPWPVHPPSRPSSRPPSRPPSRPRAQSQAQFRTYDTALHAPTLPVPTITTPLSMPSVTRAPRPPSRPPSRNPVPVAVAAPEFSPESIHPINSSTPSLSLPFHPTSIFPPGPSPLNPHASNNDPIRPISVHNAPLSPLPTPHSGPMLVDGYIPSADRNSLFSLPPPHELSAPVPSSSPAPGPSTPGPSKMRDYAYSSGGGSKGPFQAPIAPLQPRPVTRTTSTVSRGSTRISEYDLVSPPRGGDRGKGRENTSEVSPTQRIVDEWRSANRSPSPMPVPQPQYPHPFPRPHTNAAGGDPEKRDYEEYERSNWSEHDGAREYDARRRALSPGPGPSQPPRQRDQSQSQANVRSPRVSGGPRRPKGVPVQPSSSSQSERERERARQAAAAGPEEEPRSRSPLDWLFRRNRSRAYSSPTVPGISIEPPSGTPSAQSVVTMTRPNMEFLSPESANHELPLPGDDELNEFLDDHAHLLAPGSGHPPSQPQHQNLSQRQKGYDFYMQNQGNVVNELPMGFVPLSGPTVTVMHMSSSPPKVRPSVPRRSRTPGSKLGHGHSHSEGYATAPIPPGVSYPDPPAFEVERSTRARVASTAGTSTRSGTGTGTGTGTSDSRRKRLMSLGSAPSPAPLARPISIFSESTDAP